MRSEQKGHSEIGGTVFVNETAHAGGESIFWFLLCLASEPPTSLGEPIKRNPRSPCAIVVSDHDCLRTRVRVRTSTAAIEEGGHLGVACSARGVDECAGVAWLLCGYALLDLFHRDILRKSHKVLDKSQGEDEGESERHTILREGARGRKEEEEMRGC